MSPRTMRNALMLAGEAQRQIRAAGRTPPPQEYLLAVLMAHAKLVTRAAMAAARAERQANRAQALARECAVAALAMADAVAQTVIEATPAVAQHAPFDPRSTAKFALGVTSSRW
jgi:hypothetical protein